MAKEFEIKIGRPENRARYEECISKIKKAFADYIGTTRNKVEKRLTWTGKEYVLKEDGSFLRKDSKRNNIKELEMDVASFVKFVTKQTSTAYDSKNSKSNFGISVTHLSDIVDKVLPEMSCAIARPVGDDLYWVTKGEYNGYTFEDFRQLVEANTTFNTIYTIPLKYSSFNFEKDSHSGYMDSCEVKCCGESKKATNLESLFTRALSGIDCVGIIEGKLDIEGVTVDISRKKNLIVSITSGSMIVVLGANPEKSKIVYTCKYTSMENITASLEGVMKALGNLCELTYREDTYTNCKVEEISSTGSLDYLLNDMFR